MWKTYSFTFLVTFFVLKPFLNGIGCDFKYSQNNSKIIYTLKCKNGIVVSDFLDKTTNVRTIRKSIYGYWGGFVYNLPIFENKFKLFTEEDISTSILTKFELFSLWSIYSVQSKNDRKLYSFIDDYEANILVSNFDKPPVNGLIQ
ncbi:hypothetical protein AB2327_17380 [Vibrio cholerae]|uniref:hypothetical protein n=1 Tax=Vibrio cholerae TaxID=666 RepID=UPI003F99A034